MKLVLVVGANGFLGSTLVNKLIEERFDVVAVYNSSFDSINKKAKIINKYEFFVWDVELVTILYL